MRFSCIYKWHLCSILRENSGPLCQLDCATEGKAVPAQNIVYFFKKHHNFGSSASVGIVAPTHNVEVHQPETCVHLSAGSEETPHNDIDSLPPSTSQKAEQCIACYI